MSKSLDTQKSCAVNHMACWLLCQIFWIQIPPPSIFFFWKCTQDQEYKTQIFFTEYLITCTYHVVMQTRCTVPAAIRAITSAIMTANRKNKKFWWIHSLIRNSSTEIHAQIHFSEATTNTLNRNNAKIWVWKLLYSYVLRLHNQLKRGQTIYEHYNKNHLQNFNMKHFESCKKLSCSFMFHPSPFSFLTTKAKH